MDSPPGLRLCVRRTRTWRRFSPATRPRPTAWADTIRRSQGYAAAARADRGRAGGPAGTARRAAGGACRRGHAGRPGHPRGHHRPAGRRFRRTALHAAQGAHRHEAGDEGLAEHGVPVVPVFWIDAEDHDWPEVSRMYGARRRAGPAHGAAGRPPGRGRPAHRASHAHRRDHRGHRRPGRGPARHRVPPRPARRPSRGLPARRRAWPTSFGRWLEHVLGPHGLVVYDSSDPAAKPLARDIFVKEVSQPGDTAPHRRPGRRTPSWRAATTRRRRLAEGTVSLFHLSDEPRGDPHRGRRGTHRRTAPDAGGAGQDEARQAPAAFQPQRAAAADRAGHDLPHDLLRGRPQRTRLSGPAARRLRALRHPDAADVPARHGDAGGFGDAALPHQVRAAARRAAARKTRPRSTSCSRASCPRPSSNRSRPWPR